MINIFDKYAIKLDIVTIEWFEVERRLIALTRLWQTNPSIASVVLCRYSETQELQNKSSTQIWSDAATELTLFSNYVAKNTTDEGIEVQQ